MSNKILTAILLACLCLFAPSVSQSSKKALVVPQISDKNVTVRTDSLVRLIKRKTEELENKTNTVKKQQDTIKKYEEY